jgi:hypothetical protein
LNEFLSSISFRDPKDQKSAGLNQGCQLDWMARYDFALEFHGGTNGVWRYPNAKAVIFWIRIGNLGEFML